MSALKFSPFSLYCPLSKIVSEYDQEIPQSQLHTNPLYRKEETPNNHETPGRHTKQSTQLSLPHRDDSKATMDTK